MRITSNILVGGAVVASLMTRMTFAATTFGSSCVSACQAVETEASSCLNQMSSVTNALAAASTLSDCVCNSDFESKLSKCGACVTIESYSNIAFSSLLDYCTGGTGVASKTATTTGDSTSKTTATTGATAATAATSSSESSGSATTSSSFAHSFSVPSFSQIWLYLFLLVGGSTAVGMVAL